MRVVITGASGFLGGAVLRRLTEAGFDCLGVSRMGVSGLYQVEQYSEAPDGDVLIHLAEVNDRAHANRLGAEYERHAADTLNKLLEKKYGRVIYASSAVLYGDNVCIPHLETDPVSASDTYSQVKLASERAVLSRDGLVARLANIYGPGMAEGNVLSHILNQLDLHAPVSLQDTGPVRDFLWIGDAVEALLNMVTSPMKGLFNVGTGVGTSIGGLAKAVLDIAGQPDRKIVSMHQTGRPSCIVLDIAKTTKHLNWQPTVTLQEGLERIINAHAQLECK